MAYVRTTEDEYEVQQYTPIYGWECVCTEVSRKDAREQVKVYRENEPHIPVRWRKRRVKKEKSS